MNVLYIYKHVDNFDITNSIRILKECEQLVNIFIIGDDPKVEGVTHIPHKQMQTNRSSRVFVMILKACGILDDFVLMYDDTFISESFDLKKYYNCGKLKYNQRKPNGYQKCIKNTIDFLEYHKKTTLKYDCHQPMLINSKKFLDMCGNINWMNVDLLPKSLYGNWYELPSTEIENLKASSLTEIKRKYNQYGCVSTTDQPNQFIKEYVLSLP